MQFFEHLTQYQRVKRDCKREHIRHVTVTAAKWYEQMLRHGTDGTVAVVSAAHSSLANAYGTYTSEQTWLQYGEPYYKIYPQMAWAMSEVSIDIPVSELQYPYPSFAICLADDPTNDFCEGSGPRLKSMLVHDLRASDKVKLVSDASRALLITYTFDGMWRGIPVQFDFVLSLDATAGTMEDTFHRSWMTSSSHLDTADGEYHPSRDMCHRIIKLAVATAFFGIDRHELVMPDLPRKKLEQMHRQGLSNSDIKQHHRNTLRWHIGKEISLPRPTVTTGPVLDGVGREMTHAYPRRGHMRWQRYGPGLQFRYLRFIHPLICRPDLPLAVRHGYRIPDQQSDG